MKKLILTLAIIFSLGACSTQIDNTERLSIAKVQKEIKIHSDYIVIYFHAKIKSLCEKITDFC